MIQVGAFEAKTHFSEILREIEKGQVYHVTKHGKLVAIISSPENQRVQHVSEAFERLISLKKKVNLGTLDEITNWKNEGRK